MHVYYYVSILTLCTSGLLVVACGDASPDPMPAKASSGVVAAPKPLLRTSCVSVVAI